MSVSFPASPTTGQVYQQWAYDGTKWVQAAGTPLQLSINRQVFTASGTYFPSVGLIYCDIECVGGGGGGSSPSGAATYYVIAGGGGAGAYSKRMATAGQIGTSQVVTIGVGGNGGASAGAIGAIGGDTSVGSLCIAKGAAAATSSLAPGKGGPITGGVGDVVVPGQNGRGGGNETVSTGAWNTGAGGSGPFGAGAPDSAWAGTAVIGAAAAGYGAGGAGGSVQGTNAAAGGNGTPGLVVITEYCWVASQASVQSQPVGSRVLLMSSIVAPASPVAAVNMFRNFDNTYDQYELECYDVQVSASSASVYMRVSTDGSTFDSTANYAVGQTYGSANNTGGFSGATGNSSMILLGALSNVAAALAESRTRFSMPYTTDRWKYFNHSTLSQGATPGSTVVHAGLIYTNTAALKGLGIAVTSGNITRGVFNLYGIVKAGAGGS